MLVKSKKSALKGIIMNFFSKKDLIYLLIISILLLTAVFFAFRVEISEEKYESYRGKIVNGALECSIQLLGEYVETGESHLAPFLSSRLSELPLGDEEREAVIQFCTDVSQSGCDPDAKGRATAYASLLMSALIENRKEIKGGDMSAFPLYEDEIPTVSQPDESPYLALAKRILGVSDVRSYTRGDVIGYRTASSYAEFENGAFVRYLCRRDGDETVTLKEARADAERFARLYCGGGKIISEGENGGVFTFDYGDFYLAVSHFGGVMRYERTKI